MARDTGPGGRKPAYQGGMTMTKPLRLGNDPLGRLESPAGGHRPASGPGGGALDRILSAPPAPARWREPDALTRTLQFIDDIIDGLDTALPCRPRITVDAESELADLPMRQAYLLGHALRLILGLGEDAPRSGPHALPLHIHLHSRLSGRLEPSVTDDGAFFPGSLRLFEEPHPDIRELADFVSRRGGSVLVTRGQAIQVSVVVWSPQTPPPPRYAAE